MFYHAWIIEFGQDSETEETEIEEFWELRNFVDEFGEDTSDQYISGAAWGTFNNSATTKSELLVIIQVTKNYIGFGLFEYGDRLVKNSYSRSVEYEITMRTSDGKKPVYMVGWFLVEILFGLKMNMISLVQKTDTK